MTNVDPPVLEDFIASGRTGRRNALPDILDEKHSETGTADMTLSLDKLQCSGKQNHSYLFWTWRSAWTNSSAPVSKITPISSGHNAQPGQTLVLR